MYASDFPHWDNSYPKSVKELADRADLTDAQKRRILADNARQLLSPDLSDVGPSTSRQFSCGESRLSAAEPGAQEPRGIRHEDPVALGTADGDGDANRPGPGPHTMLPTIIGARASRPERRHNHPGFALHSLGAWYLAGAAGASKVHERW